MHLGCEIWEIMKKGSTMKSPRIQEILGLFVSLSLCDHWQGFCYLNFSFPIHERRRSNLKFPLNSMRKNGIQECYRVPGNFSFWPWLSISLENLAFRYWVGLSSWIGVFMVAQMVKNLSAMQETHVRSLGWEDHLEKEMATHSSILPGKSHRQRSLAGYHPWDCKELDSTEWLPLSLSFSSWIICQCQHI